MKYVPSLPRGSGVAAGSSGLAAAGFRTGTHKYRAEEPTLTLVIPQSQNVPY